MTSVAVNPRDRWIPWYFVLFFVVLALVDGAMVTIAVRTQTGVVTTHAYEKGLAYNQTIAAAEKQTALGWKSTITFTGKGEKAGALSVAVRDAKGVTIKPDSLRAEITRPTQAGMDFSQALKSGENLIKFPASGLWEVRIFAMRGDDEFQQAKRIVVP
ncbi:MAG: hypothetical protein EBR02_02855 [Alphaproteobacteria bacterium]|nr:hypothetical protein [Alphaproteobacteria bacterium]